MAKILVTETVHSVGPDLMVAAGHEVVYGNYDPEIIQREAVDADAIIVRVFPITAEFLATAKNVKIVSKHGVGVDNIDLDYCREHGIAVTVTPNANSLSVAEHAFALMMTLAKNIIPITGLYKEMGFKARDTAICMELTGKTLGLIGMGAIGKNLVKICRDGFAMNVIAYDPYVKEAPEGVTLVSTVEEVLAACDVLSLHCALTPETKKLINKERIALMKPTALIINCARGPIIDEADLINALQEGKIAGAGLDVTDPEPVSPDSVLFQLPNVIVTPHFAPSTLEGLMRVSQIAAENVVAVLSSNEPVGRIV